MHPQLVSDLGAVTPTPIRRDYAMSGY